MLAVRTRTMVHPNGLTAPPELPRGADHWHPSFSRREAGVGRVEGICGNCSRKKQRMGPPARGRAHPDLRACWASKNICVCTRERSLCWGGVGGGYIPNQPKWGNGSIPEMGWELLLAQYLSHHVKQSSWLEKQVLLQCT